MKTEILGDASQPHQYLVYGCDLVTLVKCYFEGPHLVFRDELEVLLTIRKPHSHRVY